MGHSGFATSDLEKDDHINPTTAPTEISKVDTTEGPANIYDSVINSPAADQQQFLVALEGPEDPKNFSSLYKAWLTMQMALLAFVGSFGASILAPAESTVATQFDLSIETTVLVVALFVLGYAFGPMIWAPISETYGRKVSMLPAIFVQGLFSIGTAVSTGPASLFITRFFGGLFGSAAISNASAAIGDFYHPKTRGVPMAFMALCVVGGPCLAPLVGAAILVNPHLGWRCTSSRLPNQSLSAAKHFSGTAYVQAIITFFVVVLTSFCLPETYPTLLLNRKTRRLRKETGKQQYRHAHEVQNVTWGSLMTKYTFRPLQ